MTSKTAIAGKWAIILCGGRGSRLGALTHDRPKPLVEVHGKPILWYTLLTLSKHGFRKFILPTGYRGQDIIEFVDRNFSEHGLDIRCVPTGVDTNVAGRLKKVLHLVPEGDDFFLVNGDTLFDFSIEDMLALHSRKGSLVTLSSTEITSTYGLIFEHQGEVVDFKRDSRIAYFSPDHQSSVKGYINAGLAWINRDALSQINLDACDNFEQELFEKLVAQRRVTHYKIDGTWYAIDTPKDLDTINLKTDSRHEMGVFMKEVKSNLASRYSYRTRYFDDVEKLAEGIRNRTVIPHQVEVQPGPMTGEICWLKCPYCYGLSAQDTGERLSPERYVEIMRQIAEGGVNKVVYAGYATDPLNYKHLEDLVQVSRDYEQIIGFHTKAIKVSDRLVDQITEANLTPLSYFSVSVDAGTNASYNTVHGVEKSKARIYDKVLRNLSRISEARTRTGAPLDLSVTYLVNQHNNSTGEVVKAIDDLKAAGVDLVRFTFPQVPRGYTIASDDPNVPTRERVAEYLDRLLPIIEDASDESCQVLMLDLDDQYQTHGRARTLPCFARFIFPSIGFDGWLSHCSESAAPHFRGLTMGNLNERDFWDVFYDYDVDNLPRAIRAAGRKMDDLGCKCDRKEHVVNDTLRAGGIMDLV